MSFSALPLNPAISSAVIRLTLLAATTVCSIIAVPYRILSYHGIGTCDELSCIHACSDVVRNVVVVIESEVPVAVLCLSVHIIYVPSCDESHYMIFSYS